MTDTESTEIPRDAFEDDAINVRLPLIVLTIVGAVLRLYALGQQPLWRDEGTAYFVATLPWKKLWEVLVFERANMVFYFLVVRLWALVADGEFALRLTAAIPGIAAILLVYWMGSRWLSRSAGLYGALALALSSIHIRYSQELRGYSMMVALLILSGVLLERAGREGRRSDLVGHVLTASLAFYCSTSAAFLLVPFWITAPIVFPRRKMALLFASLWSGLLMAPLLFVTVRADLGILGTARNVDISRLHRTLWPITMGRLTVFLLIPLAAIVLTSMIRKSRHSRQLIAISVWFALPIAAIAGTDVVPAAARYVIVTIIPLCLLIGFGLSVVPRGWPRAIVVIGLLFLSGRSIAYTAYPPKPDWRAATAYMVQRWQPGDGLAFFSTQGVHSFLYYARDVEERAPIFLPEDPAWWTREMPPDVGEVAMRAKEYSRVWFVASAQIRGRIPVRFDLDQILSRDFRIVDKKRYSRIDVYLYERMGAESGIGTDRAIVGRGD